MLAFARTRTALAVIMSGALLGGALAAFMLLNSPAEGQRGDAHLCEAYAVQVASMLEEARTAPGDLGAPKAAQDVARASAVADITRGLSWAKDGCDLSNTKDAGEFVPGLWKNMEFTTFTAK